MSTELIYYYAVDVFFFPNSQKTQLPAKIVFSISVGKLCLKVKRQEI